MIYWPKDFPCFLLDDHEEQAEELYARVEMESGAARLRRKYPTAPKQRKAVLFLEGADPARFDAFYENDIQCGVLRFSAPFQTVEHAAGIRFFDCEFVEPYQAEYVALAEGKRAWRVTCKFRLYGEGRIDSGMLVPAELRAGVRVVLKGRAAMRAPASLQKTFTIALKGSGGATAMQVNFGVSLHGRAIEKTLPYMSFIVAISGKGNA